MLTILSKRESLQIHTDVAFVVENYNSPNSSISYHSSTIHGYHQNRVIPLDIDLDNKHSTINIKDPSKTNFLAKFV